ncbi:MAG: hypothetical protein LUC95_06960, partial [Lachnospiraceae bacterium]|nr:hypothetical protein [Lachnospiraceae bacterium]
YQAAYDAADAVQDAEIRASLLERLAYKKSLLDGEVAQTWQAVIDEEAAQAQTEQDLANELAAQESLELAAEALKEKRVSLVESYIDALKSCSYYTEHVGNLISYGEEALEKCAEYEEYASLSSRFSAAVSAAEALPEYDESETDDIPEPDDAGSAGSGSTNTGSVSGSSGSTNTNSRNSSSGSANTTGVTR